MSAPKPDFYIGISTQNPPTIISIGRTIDGMEEIEVRLDQPDEDKLNIFKGKIDDIQTREDSFELTNTIKNESENNPIKEESPVATEPVDILPIPPVNDSQEQLQPTPEENNPIKEESPVATEPVDILPIPPVNDSQEQLPPTPEENNPIKEESPVATEPVDILPIPPANDSPEQLPPTPPTIETCSATERDIIPSEDCNPNTQKPKPLSWLRFHPDKNLDCRDIATEKFKELTNTCEKYTPEEKVSVTQEVQAIQDAPLPEIKGSGKKTKRRRNKRRLTKRRKTKRSKSNK